VKIYFACSITGGRKDEIVYQQIVKALLMDNHQVPTADLAQPEILALEKIIDPAVVYNRDTGWIQESDALIAEVSTPSHGVGYEIGFALGLGKPVICLYKQGAIISKMILGNQDRNLSNFEYKNTEDAISFIRKWLKEIEQP
jgi:nucleoside 2-deoxyribosyltransferase